MAWPRVSSGDRVRIPADAYNAMLEAAEALRGSRLRLGAGAGRDGASLERVLVRNVTAEDLPAFGAVSLGPGLLSSTAVAGAGAGQVVLEARPCDGVLRHLPVGLLLLPLAAGTVGEAVIGGLLLVPVTIVDAGDAWVAPAASQVLVSAPCGVGRLLGDNGAGLSLVQWLGEWQPAAQTLRIVGETAPETLLGLTAGGWLPISSDLPGPAPVGISLGSSDGQTTVLLSGPWAADGATGTAFYAGPSPGVLATTPPSGDGPWTRPLAFQVTPRLRWLPGQTLGWQNRSVQACVDDVQQTISLAGMV